MYNILSVFPLLFILIEEELSNLYLYFNYVQVDGKLVILVGAFCFEHICSRCHLLSF